MGVGVEGGSRFKLGVHFDDDDDDDEDEDDDEDDDESLEVDSLDSLVRT